MDDKHPSSISRASSTSSITSNASSSSSSKTDKKKSGGTGLLSIFNHKEQKDKGGKQKDDQHNVATTTTTTNTTAAPATTTNTLSSKELKAIEKEREKQREEEKARAKEAEEKKKEEEKKRLKEEKQRLKALEKEKEKQREQEMQMIKDKLKELKQKQKDLKKQNKNKDGGAGGGGGESTHSHDSTNSIADDGGDDDEDLSISSSHSVSSAASTQKKRLSLDISAITSKLFHHHHHSQGNGSNSDHSQQSQLQPQQRRTLGQHRGSSTLSFDYQKNSATATGDTTPRKTATENDLTYTSTDDSDFTSTNPTIIETPSQSIDNSDLPSPHTKNSTSPSSLTAQSYSPPNNTHSLDDNVSSSSSLLASNNDIISDSTRTLAAEFKREMERFYGRIEECQRSGVSYQLERIKELKDALKVESTSPLPRLSPKKRTILNIQGGGAGESHPHPHHHHLHHRSYSTTAAPQDLKFIMKEIQPGSDSSPPPPTGEVCIIPSNALKSSSDSIGMSNPDLSSSGVDKNQRKTGLLRRRWNANRLSLTLTRNQINTINSNVISNNNNNNSSNNNNNNNTTNINNNNNQDQSNVNRFIPSFDGTRLKKYLPTVNFRGIGDHLPSFQILPSRNKKKENDHKEKNQEQQKQTEFKKNIDDLLQSFQETKRPKISVFQEYRERLQLRKPIYTISQLSNLESDLEKKSLIQHSTIVFDLERCKRINQEMKDLNSRLDYYCDSMKEVDADLPFDLQLRVDNLKPVVDDNLNESHKLYEKSKRLEESVQIIRRQSKNSRYAYIQNIFVKLFITGWLVTIYSFFIGKWNNNNNSNVNSDNNTEDNSGNNLEYNNNNNNNGNDNNQLQTNIGGGNMNGNNINGTSSSGYIIGNSNNSINHYIENEYNYTHNNGANNNNNNNNIINTNSNSSSSNINSGGIDSLAREIDKKDKQEIMKVAMSNLDQMSRTISLMRENEQATK